MNSFNRHKHTQTHTGLHTPFIMSDDGESSTPPPCELWMVLHEECEENEMRRVKHKHDEFFQKVYGLYTQELQSPKYTVDSMGENGWEKWCDYLLKPPPPSSVQARLNGPGGRWGAGEAGREAKMVDGDEDVKMLNVCAVIVSVGEIMVSCTV